MYQMRTLLTIICIITGCSSSATLIPPESSKLYLVSEELDRQAFYGTSGIDLSNEEAAFYWEIVNPNDQPTYFVISAPTAVDGEIKIPDNSSNTKQNGNQTTTEVGRADTLEILKVPDERYSNQILKAHRYLLKGEISSCLNLLDHMDEKYSITYGSLVIRGLAQLIQGDYQESSKTFRTARSILPDSKLLDVMVN